MHATSTREASRTSAPGWPPPLSFLVRTSGTYGAAVARLVLGGIMAIHAAQGWFGWFGGPGMPAALEILNAMLGVPLPWAVVAIATQTVAPIGLLLGLLGRLAALGTAAFMAAAVGIAHWHEGFFAFELHVLAIGLALVVMVDGSGAWSLDHLLTRRRPQHPPPSPRHR